ncbi:hypothetical protein [Ruegeria lacuscaerulensis]|uniref:hypothetical protein n=1 Tax=Ruegeria lacuscaerulensis TaxID=55218 RepID=UPI0014814E8A|nr:hypothetical protein [Ruegeria lacuscaerulensis]
MKYYFLSLAFSVCLTALQTINPALAQEASEAEQASDEKFRSKDDKTGTNPINFQKDVRLYHEYQDLGGGNTGNVTTFEYRTPFAKGKWQFRIKIPHRSVDVTGPGFFFDEAGLGDINFRVLTVPYLNPETRQAFAYGLEVWLPTASEDILGDDDVVLGPQLFYAFFNPFGIKSSGLFPGIQHAFNVGSNVGDDVNETRFDVFFLKQWPEQQLYMLLNPQYIVDWENDTQGGVFDAEVGYTWKSGVTLYGRPGVGLGPDEPLDWNFEGGVKYIF